MTRREKQILEIICDFPMISQQEIADQLQINRSSVAAHIASLTHKGYIAGRGYVLSQGPSISVVGGCNVDIEGQSLKALQKHVSNPGKVRLSVGGVGHNIAENLARLEAPVQFFSAVGQDWFGQLILENLQKLGFQKENILQSSTHASPLYLSILDQRQDLFTAVSQMDIYESLDPVWLGKRNALLKHAGHLVLDTNLSEQALTHLCSINPTQIRYADPVSAAKCAKLKPLLSSIDVLKPNLEEASVLTGMPIHTPADIEKAARCLQASGVGTVLLSAGRQGVYAYTKEQAYHLLIQDPPISSTTGAGDAFLAGFIYSRFQDYSFERCLRHAGAAAWLTLTSLETVNPSLSPSHLAQVLQRDGIQLTPLRPLW